MQANPDKFQAMAIGKKTFSEEISFNFGSVTIRPDNEIKLLGVDIDYRLNFNSHIANICKKASRQLNVLKRIGKYLCKLSKLSIYHSFILSNLNYCPLAWHFCNEQNTRKLENIQERALSPDSMTMLGQRWPMVVRARWPNIIKKALAQRNFAHRPYVRPTCWFYVGPSCWPNNRPTWRSFVGPTLAHGSTCTLAQHRQKGVGST